MRSLINWDPFSNLDNFFDDDWFPRMRIPAQVLRSIVNLKADDKKIKIDIDLPEDAEVDKLDAKFEDGTLSLIIPRKKAEKSKAKKIDIKVKKK